VPFFVAAPGSTIDALTPNGESIVIEERSREEIAGEGARGVPHNATVYNPAFDVTPWDLVTGIITETGLMTPPFHFAAEGRKQNAPS
jgi:methylthioribose-1-phosphate isomerase